MAAASRLDNRKTTSALVQMKHKGNQIELTVPKSKDMAAASRLDNRKTTALPKRLAAVSATAMRPAAAAQPCSWMPMKRPTLCRKRCGRCGRAQCGGERCRGRWVEPRKVLRGD